MSPSGKSRPSLRSACGPAAGGATRPSVLRLAARGRLTQAGAPTWLDGLRRALRAGGPAAPWPAMLCELAAGGPRPGPRA